MDLNSGKHSLTLSKIIKKLILNEMKLPSLEARLSSDISDEVTELSCFELEFQLIHQKIGLINSQPLVN